MSEPEHVGTNQYLTFKLDIDKVFSCEDLSAVIEPSVA